MVVGAEANTHPTILVSLRVEWRRLEPEPLAQLLDLPVFLTRATLRCVTRMWRRRFEAGGESSDRVL
jgi:hypothetical protein